jgi:hypothetical protein
MSGIILVCFAVFGFGGYYLGKSSSNTTNSSENTIITTSAPVPVVSTNPSVIPASSLPSQSEYGPQSLWSRNAGKAEAFLSQKVVLQNPAGWEVSDCGSSINFHPTFEGCATEPDAFVINVYPDSPHIYEAMKNNSSSYISNTKENLVFGGKQAIQFDEEVREGPSQGKYKKTIIRYSDDTYLYVTLNQLSEEIVYENFLANIRFK